MDIVSEPLRPAAPEEIEQLVNIYEQLLPESVQFVSLLQNILRMRDALHGEMLEEASHRFRKTVYIPKQPKSTQFATFLAISLDEDIHVIISSLQQPPSELEDAIRNSNYIKWHLKPRFVIGDGRGIRESLYKIAKERNISMKISSDCINYWIPREKAANFCYDVPDDVELRYLQVEHAKVIDNWWPHRYDTSQRFFETAIRHYGSLGLFDKTDGRLVACVLRNDHGGVGHLYTIPDRNNRGYGTTLAKAMSKLIAKEHKHHVHTFIDRTNTRSRKLFEKLGFIPVNQTQWHRVGEKSL